MAKAKTSKQPPASFSDASKSAFKQSYTTPLVQQMGAKGAEHATVTLNLLEMATVGFGAVVTAEVNHTRPANNVWTWRVVEMVASVPVLAYNGHKNTLGRLALGVFVGALVESVIDSSPGLTGWDVLPPDDSTIYYEEGVTYARMGH